MIHSIIRKPSQSFRDGGHLPDKKHRNLCYSRYLTGWSWLYGTNTHLVLTSSHGYLPIKSNPIGPGCGDASGSKSDERNQSLREYSLSQVRLLELLQLPLNQKWKGSGQNRVSFRTSDSLRRQGKQRVTIVVSRLHTEQAEEGLGGTQGKQFEGGP